MSDDDDREMIRNQMQEIVIEKARTRSFYKREILNICLRIDENKEQEKESRVLDEGCGGKNANIQSLKQQRCDFMFFYFFPQP